MICEARPNVTADIFSLCIKTGNACVLKGGGDARHSNEAIAALLHEARATKASTNTPSPCFLRTTPPSEHC